MIIETPRINHQTDCLLIIDVQNDFCQGGALAVPQGDEVVPLVNALSTPFAHTIMTQDWHPKNHQSFASAHSGKSPFEMITLPYGEQILWPDHCVQGSAGAEFHPDLAVKDAELILRKGFRVAIDSYSAFFENDQATPTGLSGYLKNRGLSRVFMTGLATDFCVGYSAIDAINQGFAVVLIEDACRAINQHESGEAMLKQLEKLGVIRIQSADLL